MVADMFAPVPIQRLEGLVLLVTGVVAFVSTEGSWWWFAAFLLVPDVSMVGYLRNPSAGAATYNVGHTIVGPALLAAWSVWGGPGWAFAAAAIWLTHIGMDRLFGYGLKYQDDFTHTHLGTIGRRRYGATREP
jgi:hypothetical protein